MRDYGKVHTSFWTSDTLADLGDDARFLALYLLTCQHGNMAGVFRLPMAYAVEDTGWTSERLGNGFQTLSDADWLRRDPKTGWTWIRKFTKWNRPDNPNQQKAIDKQIDQLPESVSFHAELTSTETVGKPLDNTSVPVPVPSSVPVTDLGAAVEIAIPLIDGTEILPPVALLAELRRAYPRVDIAVELTKARAWSFSKPDQRKTKPGPAKFPQGREERPSAKPPPETGASKPGGGRRFLGGAAGSLHLLQCVEGGDDARRKGSMVKWYVMWSVNLNPGPKSATPPN